MENSKYYHKKNREQLVEPILTRLRKKWHQDNKESFTDAANALISTLEEGKKIPPMLPAYFRITLQDYINTRKESELTRAEQEEECKFFQEISSKFIQNGYKSYSFPKAHAEITKNNPKAVSKN